MIRDFFDRIRGPHFFIFLVFCGLASVVLIFSVRGYKEHSQKEIEVDDVAAGQGLDISIEELQAMFDVSRDISPDRFEVVASKNLFSPDRKAWQPPPPSDDKEEPQPARTRRVNPREFRLYGVTLSGDEKMALVYYQRLPENSRNRLVSEGETVYQERDKGPEVFRVASIGAESVTLEANGDSFEVGLFSHERQATKTGDQDRIAVVIGGTDEPVKQKPGEPRRPGVLPGPETGPSARIPSESADPAAATDDPEVDPEERPQPGSLPELLQRMREGAEGRTGEQPAREQRVHEMEAQVQEGTMRRIDTPFGPIYRPEE